MSKPSKKPCHGEILGFYAVIFDANLGRKIIIPVNRADLLRGRVRLP